MFVLVLATSLTGCGGPSTEPDAVTGTTADPAETQVDAQQAATDSADAETPDAADAETPDPAGEPETVPGSGTGMQLPSTPLPEDAQDETGPKGEQGPAKPGQGGIEMPELEPQSSSSSSPAADIEAELAQWQAIESHVKSTGKITVVDLWSTACAPCLEEFPGLVRLSNAMPDQVACVGVSVDYDGRKTKPADSYAKSVNAFLNAVKADFDNFLCQTPSDDVFSELDLPSIPAVLIFNEKGELVKRFVDAGETIGFTYDKDVIPYVKELAG